MTEKEERIAVAKMLVNTDDEGSAKLDHFKIYSRQEAIEKMAKAICLERNACVSKGEMCGLCELWRNFSTHAEASLNALLNTDMPKDVKNQN